MKDEPGCESAKMALALRADGAPPLIIPSRIAGGQPRTVDALRAGAQPARCRRPQDRC